MNIQFGYTSNYHMEIFASFSFKATLKREKFVVFGSKFFLSIVDPTNERLHLLNVLTSLLHGLAVF